MPDYKYTKDYKSKYSHIPRKIFDKTVERLERKIERLVADMIHLESHVGQHHILIDQMVTDLERQALVLSLTDQGVRRPPPSKEGTEGL